VELECPHCYDEIGYTFNETSALVGKFFSSAKFDEKFLISVNFTLYKLLELQELIQNITQRREYLQTRLDEIQKSLKRKEANQTRLSQILDQIFRISSSVETQSVANQMNITRVLDILKIVSNNLNIAERNVSIAQGLIEEILNIFSNLVNATNVLEIASFNQSVAVQAILQQAYVLSDNATDVLADMCEILDMENSTLTLLEGLNDCATKELDSIIEQVETKLQIAIENASQVYSESNRLYKLVIDLVLPEGVDKLLNESRIVLGNVNTVSTREAELHRNIQGLEGLFMLLDISVQALSRRIGNLNETALDLIGRGEASLELANMTAIKTEGVINEIYNLSAYLEQKLKEFISFAGQLENITKIVERAENISNISLATAEGQLTVIREIRRIINKSENLIKIIEETVIQAEKIINQTASQVNETSVLVDVLRRNLTLLDGSVNNTERSIESLQDRGEKDRQAIERATSAINMTADKAGILEDGAAVIMNMLDQLEHDLNTTTLISEEEVNTLTQLLDNAQSKLDNNEDHLRNATMEVEQLEEQLKELEDKYDNIRLHRDLLVDIRQNLQQLNCQNEFV
jgi:coxsackievirus/adenovirus receptor